MIILANDLWKQMADHVLNSAPNEACGLFAIQNGTVLKVQPIPNVAENPRTEYRMRGDELAAFMLDMLQDESLELGIYHSHPTGPLFPSETDLQQNAYPEAIHLIWVPVFDDEADSKPPQSRLGAATIHHHSSKKAPVSTWQCKAFRMRSINVIEVQLSFD